MNEKYLNLFNEKMREYRIGLDKYQVEELSVLPNKYIYRFIKRLFDFFCALVGLIVCLIPIVIVALLIKLDSKGPVFFLQSRLGKNGKPFNIIKFRSMRIDAEKNGAQWASKDDDRVTKIGNKLRKTRLDEIPQLLNILAGQMSFVGPRPERKVFYDEFKKYITGFDKRMLVIPGLTGFAQVNGGYDLKPEEKIIFDIEYIKKRSVWMDIKVFFETFLVVFSHNGAR